MIILIKRMLIILFTLCILFQTSTCAHSDKNASPNKIEEVLQGSNLSFEKYASTEISKAIYANQNGDEITYYYCKTTYYGEKKEVSGIDINAISKIINPSSAESFTECMVNEYDAVIYKKDGFEYLCWTKSSEVSFIIKYDPNIYNENDIIIMS